MTSILCLGCLLLTQAAWASDMVRIPSGSYLPFYAPKESKREPVRVSAFWMDRFPVTNEQFLTFVKANPEWRKSRIKPIFTDGHYLERWISDFKIRNRREKHSPVTHVSWFAAQAYCEWKGKSLPTVDQWEFAAQDSGKSVEANRQRILAWYSSPSPKVFPAVGSTSKNIFGISDLQGLIWEWTLDFNSLIQGQEAREDGTKDNNLFCGNGSQGALDATDYVSFMRYGFRNSLKANYTVATLGFRCVKEISVHD